MADPDYFTRYRTIRFAWSEDGVLEMVLHTRGGAVPGDGVHTIWPMLLGPNRGRYFLLTGQRIGRTGRCGSAWSARCSRRMRGCRAPAT